MHKFGVQLDTSVWKVRENVLTIKCNKKNFKLLYLGKKSTIRKIKSHKKETDMQIGET